MDRFDTWEKPILKHGELTKWLWAVWYPENLVFGEKIDIGAFTLLQAQSGIEIGDGVEIGSHCSIYSASTIDHKAGRVVIGKNAKIGSHSTVMPGVTIGENAIIGAHSFVNRDVAPDTTVFGVPARRKDV